MTYSTRCLCSLNANQSDGEVGNKPIDWHFHSATPIPRMFPNNHTIFCKMEDEESASNTLNVSLNDNIALIGLKIIIPMIMIGKMEMELPLIYMINKFMGTCLMGPKAIFQDRLEINLASVGWTL